jgi:Rad3-related DNA helicase
MNKALQSLIDFKIQEESEQQVNFVPEPEAGVGEVAIDVGDGMDLIMPDVESEDAIEALKAKAVKNAVSLGIPIGVYPLHRMTTPKGRNVKFPFPQARVGQLEAVDECIDIIQAGRDCLLEAGTGTGKSPIAVAVATFFQDSWLLVGRNDLIDQWQNDFEKFSEMGFYKSRNRFVCVNAKAKPDGTRPTCSDKRACKEGTETKKKLISDWEEALFKHRNSGGPEPGPKPSGPGMCPYGANRDLALTKSHTAMTLALGLTMFKYLGGKHPLVTPRQLLVVDECSELESELMNFHSCTISTRTLRRALGESTWEETGCEIPEDIIRNGRVAIPAPKPEGEILAYLTDFRPETWSEAALWGILARNALKARQETIQLDIAKEKKGFERQMIEARADAELVEAIRKDMNKLVGDHVDLEEKVGDILRQVQMAFEAATTGIPYCHDIREHDNDWQLVLKPMEARGLVERLLATYGGRILFVSATTGTALNFVNTHALKRPLQKVTIPSPFPVAHRPVVYSPAGNLGSRTIDKDLPKVLDGIYKIVTSSNNSHFLDHRNQRGIVHTFTNRICDEVYRYLRNRGESHRLFVLKGGGRQREQAMEDFLACPNGILISPSAMLGLSMIDDKARYQIIAKVPYAFLGDKSVKHRMDNIPEWYQWQTAKDLIQTFGRVVRSMDDWGYTYILDGAFHYFYHQNKHMFPDYVKEAIYGL